MILPVLHFGKLKTKGMVRRVPDQRLWIIDPPGPFSPLAKWEQHLRGLRRIEDKNDQISQAIRHTSEQIAWIRREGVG
jgi:hypothetical protein